MAADLLVVGEPALIAAAEQAKTYARNARAEATRRAYASDLRDFLDHCDRHTRSALPAMPQTVALYLTELAGRRKGRPSGAASSRSRNTISCMVTTPQPQIRSFARSSRESNERMGLRRARRQRSLPSCSKTSCTGSATIYADVAIVRSCSLRSPADFGAPRSPLATSQTFGSSDAARS